MLGICPYTFKRVEGVEQLILRLDRMVRTVKGSIPKYREYGTTIRDYLGKPNSRVILTKIQNILLSEIANPINGFGDFECERVKVMPDGSIFVIGIYEGIRHEFNLSSNDVSGASDRA